LICENCGLGCPEEFKFCPRCGVVLEKRVKVDRGRIKAPKEAIFKAIQARDSTDEVITRTWILVLIIVYLTSIIAAVAIGFSIASDILRQDPTNFSRELMFDELKDDVWAPALLSGMFYAFAFVLAYMLVSRLNKHYARDRQLRFSILSFLKSAAYSPEIKQMVEFDLADMDQIDDQISSSEKKRNPIIWALAVAAPLMVSVLQWVVLFNSESYHEYQKSSALLLLAQLVAYLPLFYLSFVLGKSIYDHDSHWTSFAHQANAAITKLGFPEKKSYWGRPLQYRSYGLYAVVTVVSLGLFMFYWWYTLIEDPNHHLKAQWDFEDSLVESLRD